MCQRLERLHWILVKVKKSCDFCAHRFRKLRRFHFCCDRPNYTLTALLFEVLSKHCKDRFVPGALDVMLPDRGAGVVDQVIFCSCW